LAQRSPETFCHRAGATGNPTGCATRAVRAFCANREGIDRLHAEALRKGWQTRAPFDAGEPIGYPVRIDDPNGNSLELSFGYEVGLAFGYEVGLAVAVAAKR
jgi:hypothetical protein